jgi:hypothetical protein
MLLAFGNALLEVEMLKTQIKNRDKLALQRMSVGQEDMITALASQFL